MKNKLQVFENEEFGQLRTLNLDGVPYAVGKDVAEALGYERARDAVADHVDEEDKILLNEKILSQMAAESKGGETPPFKFDSPRGLTFINESGLYSLILSSKLPKRTRKTGKTPVLNHHADLTDFLSFDGRKNSVCLSSKEK